MHGAVKIGLTFFAGVRDELSKACGTGLPKQKIV
jgi:hypothetical protein